MAWTRDVVGSFLKSKDDSKPPYLKFKKPVAIKEGDMFRVESKKFQLTSLQLAADAGKLKPEQVDKAKERIEKMPDFVLGDVVLLSKDSL